MQTKQITPIDVLNGLTDNHPVYGNVRAAAIANYNIYARKDFATEHEDLDLRDDLQYVIVGSFDWGKTPEGASFWYKIYSGCGEGGEFTINE